MSIVPAADRASLLIALGKLLPDGDIPLGGIVCLIDAQACALSEQ